MAKDDRTADDRERARRRAESAEVLKDLADVDAKVAGARRHASQEAAVAKELEFESEYVNDKTGAGDT